MARVIGINGSPRKDKNSATLLEQALYGTAQTGAIILFRDVAAVLPANG